MNLDKLKKLAEAATPGPWTYDYGNWEVERTENRHGVCDLAYQNRRGSDGPEFVNPVDPTIDGEFIAAANPTTILDLIEKLKVCEDALVQGCWCGHGDKGTTCCCCEALAKLRGGK